MFNRLYEQEEARYPKVREKLKFNEALKAMLDRMVSDMISTTGRRIGAAAIQSLADVRACPTRLASFSDEVNGERGQAKSFLYES